MSERASPSGGGGSIAGHGLSAALPPGWEGRITQSSPAALSPAASKAAEAARAQAPFTAPPSGETLKPFMHLANFALPPKRGTFGGGAVELMTVQDALIALVEYSPESLGTALFASPSMPTQLSAGSFRPRALQRILPGQGGYQAFFQTVGRPFCLYIVLGSVARASTTLPTVNGVLASIQIRPG